MGGSIAFIRFATVSRYNLINTTQDTSILMVVENHGRNILIITDDRNAAKKFLSN